VYENLSFQNQYKRPISSNKGIISRLSMILTEIYHSTTYREKEQ